MCAKGSGSTTELTQVFRAFDASDLALQTVNKHSNFFTHCGWGCRLPVSSAEHRDLSVLCTHLTQLGQQGLGLWQPNLVHGVANGDRIGQVVDVLAGAGKVCEFQKVGATKLG